LWLHSLKVAQLLRSAACLHTNQSRSYLNHLVLEHAQNQALRLIIGAVKTTPTDAMTFITDNKPIQELIEERAVLLHEKLLIILEDQYWKTYVNKPRNLKTQNGFIQKVTEIKTKFEIKSRPQRRNPVDIEPVECCLHLQQSIINGETGTETLRHLALETMNTRYPQDKLLHIFTDGSQIDGYINASAGIHCEPFSCYMPLGQHSYRIIHIIYQIIYLVISHHIITS